MLRKVGRVLKTKSSLSSVASSHGSSEAKSMEFQGGQGTHKSMRKRPNRAPPDPQLSQGYLGHLSAKPSFPWLPWHSIEVAYEETCSSGRLAFKRLSSSWSTSSLAAIFIHCCFASQALGAGGIKATSGSYTNSIRCKFFGTLNREYGAKPSQLLTQR